MTLLQSEDFELWFLGMGPINVHTTLTFEGKGERLAATATNDRQPKSLEWHFHARLSPAWLIEVNLKEYCVEPPDAHAVA